MALLDDSRKASLRAALDSDHVAAAYLFGSQARGRPGPLSDVDLGVWASPGLDARQRFDLRLRLATAIEHALGGQPVDRVVLDDASPLLRHRAWRDGELVEYLDTKPLREQTAAGVSKRLAEGRFGRR